MTCVFHDKMGKIHKLNSYYFGFVYEQCSPWPRLARIITTCLINQHCIHSWTPLSILLLFVFFVFLILKNRCHGNTLYDQHHRSGVSNMSESFAAQMLRETCKYISDLIHCIFPGSVRSVLQWLLDTPWWPQSNPDSHSFLTWISVSKQFSTPPVLFSGNLHSLFYI